MLRAVAVCYKSNWMYSKVIASSAYKSFATNITVERNGFGSRGGTKIATVVLHRPPVNSIDVAFALQITRILREMENSNELDAIIIKSSIPGIFSAGLDLNDLHRTSRDHLELVWKSLQDLWLQLYSSKLITLALINGHCLAGGTLLASACDYRLGIEGQYKMGVTAAKIGLVAPPWFLSMLIHIMGRRMAEHALQVAQTYSPDEAVKVGLMDGVCPAEVASESCFHALEPYLSVSQESRMTMKLSFRSRLISDFKKARDKDMHDFVNYIMKESVQVNIGGTQRLPRLVGIGKAKELIFTAKIFTGEEAGKIGLAEHAVPQNPNGDAAYQKALEIAKQIADKGPIAVKMAKLSIDNGMQTDINTAMKIEESCYSQVIPTEDRIEALKAFQEKRKPVYSGK